MKTEAEELSTQLKAALEECCRLKEENRRLKSLLGVPEQEHRTAVVSITADDKVALFRSLFRG